MNKIIHKIIEGKMKIAFKIVSLIAYAILIIPIMLFFFGWLKWYLALFFSGILLYGFYITYKKNYRNNTDYIEIPICTFLIIAASFTFWVFISGNCYTSVAKGDIMWRNATLYDLVNYDWPVYYPERKEYLCYYFIFWMVPAFIGKIFGGMLAAYIALACWLILILMTAFLLIAYYFKDYHKSFLKCIVIFMIMWSGINILGQYLMYHVGLYQYPAGFGNNEGYCDALWNTNGQPFCFLYRSNEDFLGQCYNQLPIWIVVPLLLQNRNIRNYAFLGLLLFPFSPWGTAGVALMMIVDAFAFLKKNKSVSRFMREVFSVPNLSAVLSVFVVFSIFFNCNNISGDSKAFGILKLNELTPQVWVGVVIFWISEFGIFYYLTWWKYKRDYLYVSVLIMLIGMPFVWVSSRYSRDFCMDATLPQLYFLMIYMIGYIKDEFFDKKVKYLGEFKIRECFLILFLGLAFTTPVFDWINNIKTMNINKSISIQYQSVISFSDILGYEGGFQIPISTDAEQSIFFNVLAKTIESNQCKWLPISENLSKIRDIDNIDEYFDYLYGKDCMIFIAVQDIQGYSLTKTTLEKMKCIGFDDQMDVLLENEYHSFLGVVNNGQVITEQIGDDEYITYYGEGQVDGSNVWMESGTLNHGNCAIINIGNGNYSAHGRGFNIVVRDNVSKRVIDAVSFDTHTEEMNCTRKKQ